MKISYNWLKNYIDCDLTAKQMSVILTDIGLEVESMERIEAVRGGLEGVVVGEVMTCKKHPDADKLSLTTVSVGEEILQIVCGAPNVAAGQKVFVAKTGTTLYPKGEEEGLKIKRSRIRGVESLGMICAEDELGLGGSHEGIIVLDASAAVGQPAAEFLGLEADHLFEIGLTPNRIDAASHYGVARDLYAYLKAHGQRAGLKLPDVSAFKADDQSRVIDIIVEDNRAAPRYAGVTVSDVVIAPSPAWLQDRLRAIGINPKNNIVDITNFVLHEAGQPLHGFDADKIEGGKVIVRTYPCGSKLTTLDGVERTIHEQDLMICDTVKPMCIAGVFGGAGSGITEATKNVFIESAYFDPVSVRKSAKRHGLHTDASFLFERGIDPNITIWAIKRAALLMKELGGGRITSEIIDIYPDPKPDFRFDISYAKIDSLTGKHIPGETVKGILAALGIRVEAEAGGILSVAVPPCRVDVRRDVDLIEEIMRIYGYNNIEIPERLNSSLPHAPKPDRQARINLAADTLTACGFTEIMSNSLTGSAYYEGLDSYKPEGCVRILNPLSSDLNVMRQTLLFNALEAIALNSNRRNGDLKLYEFGNCYRYDASREGSALAPYIETLRLSVAVTGAARRQSWNEKETPSDFYTLRATAEKLLRRFGTDIYSLKSGHLSNDIYSEGLGFKLNGKSLFTMGALSKNIRRRFDIKAEVYFLEMDFDTLISATSGHRVQAAGLNRFPEARRDLALLLDSGVTFEQLRSIAFAAERKLLRSVSLFDVYQGDKLPAGKKSYALGFVLGDRTKTLTDDVIDRAMNNLVRHFEREANAAVRT